MDSLTDLILRYCIIFGRRFFAKEKISFLRVFSKEVMQLGYQLDAKLARLQLTKRRHQNFYNGYIGDLHKADIIICTHYDTGVKNFNLTNKYAFNSYFDKKNYLISLLPIIIAFLISIALNLFLFIPGIREVGLISFSGLLSLLTTIVLFYFIVRYHSGVPNQKNFVCNSSSLILLLNVMSKLDKKRKRKIAFVLLDGGCTNSFGLRMLESYSKDILKKTIIFVDSIGNDEQIQIFKPDSYTPNLQDQDIEFTEGYIDTQFKRYLLLTSGHLDRLKRVKVNYANSSKDNALSAERIEKHTETILNLCSRLVSSDDELADDKTNKRSAKM
ncbi:hypothetical protein DES39_1393 [Orbus hercynius]|uniref:Peptidase M28-like protein n=1 Tax=Orbus hercynius TaxID=593135 RepID=A0A495RF15_9GAMM|nr:hypothetical protein [Orbus hercynius]RKS85975.1 hypothetical protein DES39_1393 [Orbus hercynius]